jgi:hypothetical protein
MELPVVQAAIILPAWMHARAQAFKRIAAMSCCSLSFRAQGKGRTNRSAVATPYPHPKLLSRRGLGSKAPRGNACVPFSRREKVPAGG